MLSGAENTDMDIRDDEMARLYGKGYSLERIGGIYGVTKQRVRQVLVELGVKMRGAGRPPRKKRAAYRTP